MDYDFSQLNDKEFESLAIDLLSIRYKVKIERFKPGKDGGIDGRFFLNNQEEAVIQCKHYLKTGYKNMISKLKATELLKVTKIKPKKYIFVTSLPLSPNYKNEIKNIFSPYIKVASDVFGAEDLNDLLKNNPTIETSYFKLWISSATVLNRFLHNAVIGRSKYEIQRIARESKKYVQTSSFDIAIEKLRSNKILIIAGEPGIGKTTLAENICLYCVSKDFELIDIQGSIKEAEDVYIDGRRQIFYFDDFLGSNYLEAIQNRADSHVVKFIDRVKHDKTKLFILTSRTNILNSGIYHSSVFSTVNIRKDEYLLNANEITELDKAKILYNHIWFSTLDEEYIEEIYKKKRYFDIISHKNFNPRLINFITDSSRIAHLSSDRYWEYIKSTLDNPKEIWANCFKVQNNALVRALVILVVYNGGSIPEKELSESFSRIKSLENIPNTSHIEKNFQHVIELAVKSFLRRDTIGNSVIYRLFNPSIADYVLKEYCEDIDKLTIIYRSLLTIESIHHLESMNSDKIIEDTTYKSIRDLIYKEAVSSEVSLDFKINAMHFWLASPEINDEFLKLINQVASEPEPISEFEGFIRILLKFYSETTLSSFNFINTLFSHRNLNYSEVKILVEFLISTHIDDPDLLQGLAWSIEEIITDELEDRKYELDLTQYINSGENDLSVDENEIKKELSDIEKVIIEELEVDMDIDLVDGLSLDTVYDVINVTGMIEDFFSDEPLTTSDPKHHHDYLPSTQNKIDDLFDRS